MAALYSIYDLEQALEDNISNYVRVEIDGEDVGIAYRIDLLYVLKEKYRSLSTARKKSSRITSVKIYGKDHTVDHCVRIYNASASEMFENITAKEKREKELMSKNEEEASNQTLRRYSDSRFFDKADEIIETLDSSISNIHKLEENRIKIRGTDRRTVVKVKRKNDRLDSGGFFSRLKRWLKGDKGYKK